MNKIQEIKRALNKKYFEREKEIEAILTAILARQHVLLISPAGTGKSALSAEISQIIKGCNFFSVAAYSLFHAGGVIWCLEFK